MSILHFNKKLTLFLKNAKNAMLFTSEENVSHQKREMKELLIYLYLFSHIKNYLLNLTKNYKIKRI